MHNNSMVIHVNTSSSGCSSSEDEANDAHKRKHKKFNTNESQRNDPNKKKKELKQTFLLNKRPCRFQCNVRRLFHFLLLYLTISIFLLYLFLQSPQRQTAISSWPSNATRDISEYVMPDKNTTLIQPFGICNENDKTFLLIMIVSSFSKFGQRQIIRKTWGNTTEFNYEMFAKMHKQLNGSYLNPTKERLRYYNEFLQLNSDTNSSAMKPRVRILFILGRSPKEKFYVINETNWQLHDEAKEFNDILQEDFMDTYENLTIKIVLALKWLTLNCLQNVAYVMKSDDDMFVNTPNLLHFLLGGTVPIYNETIAYYNSKTSQTLDPRNRLNKTRNILMGYLLSEQKPKKNIKSKWYIPHYMYAKEDYPNFLIGSGGYLMSIDVVPRLYKTALNTTLLILEDVFLTGICAEKSKLERTHHQLFRYKLPSSECDVKGTITKQIDDQSMLQTYLYLVNINNYCAPVEQNFGRSRFL